jgi:hypothetical protein
MYVLFTVSESRKNFTLNSSYLCTIKCKRVVNFFLITPELLQQLKEPVHAVAVAAQGAGEQHDQILGTASNSSHKSIFKARRLVLFAIYAPMIFTAPCIMFWMCAYPLRGQVGGGWALDIKNFLGPVKWHQADRRVPFGAQKTRDFQGPTSFQLPK